MPTIDAAPVKQGCWVEEPDRERHWHCSECGLVEGIACGWMLYCPICGADMRKDEFHPTFEGKTPEEMLPKKGENHHEAD